MAEAGDGTRPGHHGVAVGNGRWRVPDPTPGSPVEDRDRPGNAIPAAGVHVHPVIAAATEPGKEGGVKQARETSFARRGVGVEDRATGEIVAFAASMVVSERHERTPSVSAGVNVAENLFAVFGVSDARLTWLMDRNTDGALSPGETDELESLVELSESLALVRAQALRVLCRNPT